MNERGRRGRLSVPKDERGRFMPRHAIRLDPGLAGLGAFEHPAVKLYHEWLLRDYRPRGRVFLVTPCSNVKPYPLSPASRKIAGMLRKAGLWNGVGPHVVEWVYLSDLLVWVPYWRAWDYPACCYELHPEELLASPPHRRRVVALLASILERLRDRRFVVFLPKRHLALWEEAVGIVGGVEEDRVKYTIFSTSELRETLLRVLSEAEPG